MPRKGQRNPLTAEQWGAIDAAWLEGMAVGNIKELVDLTHRQVVRCVELLGHEYKPRRWDGQFTRTQEEVNQCNREAGQRRRAKARQAVMDHYGAVCVCCGETIEKFLTIDHVNDDGAQEARHRKNSSLAEDVVKQGFPETYRILCLNCNRGRWLNGGVCPHEEMALTVLSNQGVG